MNQNETYNWNPEYTEYCDEMNGLSDEEAKAQAEQAEAESELINSPKTKEIK